jgi:tetratricopeptide (TPR) repeat protein
MMTNAPDEDGVTGEMRHQLRSAMTLHGLGQIDAALKIAEEAVERWPDYGQALSYLGQTLITRKRRFADGLAILARAVAAAPHDPYILYTAGWCEEFIANALERPKGAHQPVGEHPRYYYAQAKQHMLAALALDPEDKLRGDVEDILDVIAKATGEPWDLGEYERAAPRPR